MTATVDVTEQGPLPGPGDATGEPTASELLLRLRKLEAVAERSGEAALAGYALEARQRLEAGEIWLVVVGQFKRGKTSLINRLVGEELLPTGVVPVTSVATVLRRGGSTSLTVHFEDGSTGEVEPGDLGAYVTEAGNPGNERGVARVEVRHPSPFLGDGLVLVDTPGVGSLSAGTTEHAYGWLPRIDAALVVLSPDPPLGATEAEYLRDIAARTRHIAFAFNKVDLYPESTWKESLRYHRAVLADILDTDAEDLLIHPTSSLPDGDGASPGGAASLSDALRALVAESGSAAARVAALGRANRIRDALRAHLELRRAAIVTPGDVLAERLAHLRERHDELRRRRRDAEAILLREAQDLVRDAGESLQEWARAREHDLARLVETLARAAAPGGNHALARVVAGRMADTVKDTFEAWWAQEGEGVRRDLRAAMARDAALIEDAVGELRAWIEEEFGVAMGAPPELRPLVDSTDFYYHVQGPLPRTTFGVLGMLAPRSVFRWTLARRARVLSSEELTRNAGRIRGDLQYRVQETVRGFLADVRRAVEEDEAALDMALKRGSELQEAGEKARADTLAEVEGLLRELADG